MLKADLSQWVGRREQRASQISGSTVDMLDATVGLSMAGEGGVIPILGHWCAFTPCVPMAELSEDGHPERGGFLPPVPLPRRMWAGGDLTFHADLHADTPLNRNSTILSVDEKETAAGPMVFVTVEHQISQNNSIAITERQDIVYLDIPDEFSPPQKKPVPDGPDFEKQVCVNEAMLFRYSAATFNAHRIHYDLAFAQRVEKYPGLVVHGPLQATLLLHAAVGFSGKRPTRFKFRGVHPLFHFDDMHLFGVQMPGGMELSTGIPNGHLGMTAKIFWEE